MRVCVLVLANVKSFVLFLEDDRDDYIRGLVVWIFFIFVGVVLYIEVILPKLLVRLDLEL